jgi:hypothetical protein
MSRFNRKFNRRKPKREPAKEPPFVPFHLRAAGPPIDWRKVPSLVRDNVLGGVWQPISATETAN